MHAAMLMVTPMDKHGLFLYWAWVQMPTLAIARNAARRRREGDDRYVVLAQVNSQVPRSRGLNYIHISEIDGLLNVTRIWPSFLKPLH
jgi:hypothetical protein